MSLITAVDIRAKLGPSECDQLVASCRIGGLEAVPSKRSRPTRWEILETGDGEFGDDMLLDDANWDDSRWPIHQSAADSLVVILGRILESSPSGIEFSMAWVGETLVTLEVTPNELLDIVRGGKICTKTLYQTSAL